MERGKRKMVMTVKPKKEKDIEKFIHGAASDKNLTKETEHKTFLLRIQKSLWSAARTSAQQDDVSLHDWIIDAIARKLG